MNSGDTVTFESVDKGHNSASIKGMIPDGAEAWKGKSIKIFQLRSKSQGSMGMSARPTVLMVWLA